RPAYERLLNAEPLLRRAVPLLIVVFLAAVAAGAAVQIFDDRRQAIADTEQELSLLVLAASEALARQLGADTDPAKVRAALAATLPARASRFERRFVVTDAGGRVIAAEPAGTLPLNEHLTDLLGTSRALAMLAGSGEAFPLTQSDGTEAVVVV